MSHGLTIHYQLQAKWGMPELNPGLLLDPHDRRFPCNIQTHHLLPCASMRKRFRLSPPCYFLLRKDARQRRRSHSTQQCRHCEATGCRWHRPCCCLPRLHAAWLAASAWPFPTLSWTLRLHKDWEEPLNKNLDFVANASWRHVAAHCTHAFF